MLCEPGHPAMNIVCDALGIPGSNKHSSGPLVNRPVLKQCDGLQKRS